MSNIIEVIIRAVDQATGTLASVVENLSASSHSFERVGEAAAHAGEAITDALKEAVFTAKEYGEEVDRLSKTTGIGVETIERLGFAAQQEHASLESLATGLRFLSRHMTEAAVKGGAAAGPFEMLGVQITDLRGRLLPADQVLLQIAERFHQLPNGPMKAALAMEIFGRSGAQLVPFLSMGRAEIERLGQRAQELGIVLSGTQVSALESLGDAFDELTTAIKGFAIQIGAALGPALQPLIQTISDIISKVTQWMQANPGLTKAIVILAAALGALLTVAGAVLSFLAALGGIIAGVTAFWGALGGVITAVGGVIAAIVTGPVAIAIAIVAALGAVVYLVIRNWERLKDFFASVWDAIKGFFVNNWDTIKEVLIVLATGIPGLIIRNWDAIKSFFANLWGTISGFFINAAKNLWNIALNAGRGLIQAFVNGLRAVASAPFRLLKEIFGRIRRLLPFSDAQEGPLSDLTASGGQLAQTLAAGIAARADAIRRALHNALAAAQPSLPAFAFEGGAGGASPSVRISGGRKTFIIDVSGAVEVVLDETVRGLVTAG